MLIMWLTRQTPLYNLSAPMDEGCIYRSMGMGLLTCQRTFWLTTWQKVDVYNTGRLVGAQWYSCKRRGSLGPGEWRVKVYMGGDLCKWTFTSLLFDWLYIMSNHTAVQHKAETPITLTGQNIPQQLGDSELLHYKQTYKVHKFVNNSNYEYTTEVQVLRSQTRWHSNQQRQNKSFNLKLWEHCAGWQVLYGGL